MAERKSKSPKDRNLNKENRLMNKESKLKSRESRFNEESKSNRDSKFNKNVTPQEENTPDRPMKRVGDRATIEIKRLGINGEGVGYLSGQVVFVNGALSTETVMVEAEEVKEKYAKAKIVKIITKSKERIIPLCEIYESCGGCTLQHIKYQGQLREKREIVKEAFTKYLDKKAQQPEIKDVLGMIDPWHYRNKAQIPLFKKGDKVIAGLYKIGTNKIIEMEQCDIHQSDLDQVIQGIKDIIEELKIPIYDNKSRKGELRYIVGRVSYSTKEIQIMLVTVGNELKNAKELVKRITKRYTNVITIAQNINPSKNPLVLGDKTIILWGGERIIEEVGAIKYSLSPRSFFQLNPKQMEVLYQEVAKAAKLTGKEKVLDAYCGAGTISLWLAKDALEVRGIEEIADAIKDARINAEINNITNAHFTVGKTESVVAKWSKQGYRPDVMVVDPPRTGCGEELLKTVSEVKPKKFIYVSCNPATLVKDINYLLKFGYEIKSVQPVDMFPHTAHVECVVLMSRVEK